LNKKIFQMRGTKKDNFVEYFLEQGAVQEHNCFATARWTAQIIKVQEVKLGSLRLPEVVIEMTWDETADEQFLVDFQMAFLTAGG